MTAVYISRDGDMVDWICWRHYGTSEGTPELVYAANRELAGYGLRLPAGVEILLPDAPSPAAPVSVIRLWD